MDKVTMLFCCVGRKHHWSYGIQGNLFAPRINAAGPYELVYFELTGHMGAPYLDQDNIVTVGGWRDRTGNDVYAHHMEWTKADFSLGFNNCWTMAASVYRKYPHAHMEPVDSEPMRPDEKRVLLDGVRWPIAISKFGERVMREVGLDPMYVPCAVDSALYRPVDRTEARARVQKRIDAHEPARGFPVTLGDKFFAVLVGANNMIPARKGFYDALRAWKVFHDKHPDSVLYLFTELEATEGVSIQAEIRALGIPEGCIAWPNQYYHCQGMIGEDEINDLYNAADVLYLPSHTEGFCLPLIEAQMAGCPVITTDGSAMTENTFKGIAVPSVPYEGRSGWFWRRPDHDALIDALEDAYQKRSDANRERVEETMKFDIENVMMKYMLPALAQIADEADEGVEAQLYKKWQKQYKTKIGDVELTIRNYADKYIAEHVGQDYFPDLIDYSQVKRVVDVGAHIGSYALWVKSKSPDARIVCIEAMPENAALCRENCNHGIEGITVLEGMCAYTPGEYDLLIDPTNTGGQTIVKRGAPVPRAGNYTVRREYQGKTFDLRDALDALSFTTHVNADVLKLDCEGGEFDILMGAPAMDLREFRYIVGEYHTELGDISETLRRLDPWFTIKALRPFDNLFGLFCLERKEHVTQEG